MKLDRLAQVPADLVQRSPLSDDGDVDALGDEAGLFAWPDHRLDGSLSHSALHPSPIRRGRDVRRAHPTKLPGDANSIASRRFASTAAPCSQ
jgi:hypothetical protein